MIGNHVYGKLYRGFESLPLRKVDARNREAPLKSLAVRMIGEGVEPSRPNGRSRRTASCVSEGSLLLPNISTRLAGSCSPERIRP